VVKWGVALEEQCVAWDKEKAFKSHSAGMKREADDMKGGASKKAKSGAIQTKISGRDTLEGMSVDQLKKQVEDGKLAKATVAELRELLLNRGLETRGVKSVLIDRIEEWLEEQ
jgi:ATP-dependent DNA helicase 2 subunit 1